MEYQLLEDVKDHLHITWVDVKTEKNLIGMIRRGMARLKEIGGPSLNFLEEGTSKMLLLEYCRYANSHAIEMFETNFQSELLELNLRYQVGV